MDVDDSYRNVRTQTEETKSTYDVGTQTDN